MTEAPAADAVSERIAQVIRLLGVIEAAAEGNRAEAADDRLDVMLQRLGLATADQRQVWLDRLDKVGVRDAIGSTPTAVDRAAVTDDPRPGSAVLEELAGALAATAAGYVRLYTTARLMFDSVTCDLAAEHLRTCVEALQAINWLLPDVVGRELTDREQGLDCRCACPACSIGACLCVRNSTDTVLHAWSTGTPFGTRGLPPADEASARLDRWSLVSLAPDQGVVLTVAPRQGSPLATAGIQRGDRIFEVDGVDVRSNPEIQDALTAHDPGEEVHMRVKRASGDVANILVRRPIP